MSARAPGEVAHHYGDRVHVLDNPLLASALTRVGAQSVSRVELYAQLRLVYTCLVAEALGRELPTAEFAVPTRMAATQPEAGVARGIGLDSSAEVVIVDVIRGGIVPAQLTFELLEPLLPDRVRLDHLNLARQHDEHGQVLGADLTGSKVGGSVEGATLVFPDPMGATGSTLVRALEHYREHYGTPRRVVALTMIATPEYLRAVLDASELVTVWTARVDRGLSSPEVLATVPGERWDDERGLDGNSYIVPGAGGVGEVLNNSWC